MNGETSDTHPTGVKSLKDQDHAMTPSGVLPPLSIDTGTSEGHEELDDSASSRPDMSDDDDEEDDDTAGTDSGIAAASSRPPTENGKNGNGGDDSLSSPPADGSHPWESPHIEPVNGVVQPRVIPPPGKPTRHTNQLDFLQKEVLKAVLKHKHSWPFAKPVDSIRLSLPVRISLSLLYFFLSLYFH